MLVVLALITALVALTAQLYSATVRAAAITTGADLLSDAFTEGRENAVAQNTTVEVRIYALPTSSTYGALQLHWLKADGTTPAINPVLLLSSWIVIDATSQYSPLIGANHQIATPDATDLRLNSSTRVFHFLPDGSTDLNPATNWFLTVRAATASEPVPFPSNWACVAVNPTTGRPQIYRP